MTVLDSSCSHVLSADAPYLANLAALWDVDRDLARLIEAEDEIYLAKPSKSGAMTVAVGKVFLHSSYEPVEEGRRLAARVKADENYIFAVQGLGLGYHLEALFETAGNESIFCLFEPDLKMIRTAMHFRDLSKLIESRRVMIFSKADKGDIFNRLQPHMPMVVSGMKEIAHAPSIQLHAEFFKQIRTWLEEFRALAKTSIQTLVINGRKTAENISRNIGLYVNTPSVARLKDCHKGEPAIIVSAGPSLRKNKHLLPAAKGKAVLVAVQTTLKPLLEMGVEPDFVTSLDYHEISTRFFENLPEKLGTELVAEPKASDRIFDLFSGPISLLGNEFAEGLVRELQLDKTTLRAGATVAHLAYYLAEFMGCDPIIFVGQDLGFSDGLCYTPGTSYENVWQPELSRFCTVEMKQWEQVARDRKILRRIPDIEGCAMYTEERLYAYLQQFERDFASTKTKIVDASEGGAHKRGAEVMKLAEALERFCSKPLSPSPGTPACGERSRTGEGRGGDNSQDSTSPGFPGLVESRLLKDNSSFIPHPSSLDSIRQCILRRRSEAEKILDITQRTLPLLIEVRDNLTDQNRVNQLIARIDALRNEMNSFGQTYDLVTQLTQSTELQRFQADREIAAAKLKGLARQRRQVRRDIENVQSLMDAAGPFITLMNEVADRLASVPQELAA